MIIEEIKRDTIYRFEMDESEATHLMHICWFALDYKAEQDKQNNPTMNVYETEMATKIKEYLDSVLYTTQKEI